MENFIIKFSICNCTYFSKKYIALVGWKTRSFFFIAEHEVRESSFHQGWTPDERATSIIMMEPPVTSKVLRAPSLKRGQENVRIQDRVSKIEIYSSKLRYIYRWLWEKYDSKYIIIFRTYRGRKVHNRISWQKL